MELEYWKGLFQEIKGIRKGKSERDRKYNNTRMRSHLVKNGFSCGEVQLKELGLTVILGEGGYFLRKIEKNVYESSSLIHMLSKQSTRINKNLAENYFLFDASFEDVPAKMHLVFVEDTIDSDPLLFLYNLGHEDGHFLNLTGRRELVYDKYEVRKKYQRALKGRESFADFCGWLSASKAVHNFSGFKINDEARAVTKAQARREKRTLEIATKVLLRIRNKNREG